MAQNCSGWYWQLGLVSSLTISAAIAFWGDYTQAQPTPDSTLPSNSIVTPSDNTSIIEGGTQVGTNLFHSFTQFFIPTGNIAYFNNALTIQNIFSRVTGGSVSNIDGVIKANGTANVFLLNPNGIIFGSNARLDIKGSFLASTASSLNFADGTQFSANTPQTAPLLTVSVPIGLQFGQTQGSIRVQGSELEVQLGKTLALVGSDIALEGGDLVASGGSIDLGSVAGVGEVRLSQRGNGWKLEYGSINTFGNVKLEDEAFVNTSGEGGGDIQIQGAQLDLTEASYIYADTEGTEAGGQLFIRTTKAVTLSDSSEITADVLNTATGTGGNLTIETGQLSIRGDESFISASNYGQGKGGNLTVTALESVELTGFNSGLFTQTENAGDAGNLTITTKQLSIRDGAQVYAGNFSGQGKGGNLSVTALESVKLLGRSLDGQFPSGLFTQSDGTGDAGNLTITTKQLSVGLGAQVSTATFGQGKGGELRVNATESVNLFGVGSNRSPSGLSSRTAGEGQGGNIIVDTNVFRVADNAVVDTRTFTTGNSGNITVNANTFEAVNGGQLLASAFRGSSGRAGNITVNTTDSVNVSGSAPFKRLVRIREGLFVEDEFTNSGLFVLSRGSGDAGKLEVKARSISLDNQGLLTAETESGQGGDIALQAQDFLLLRRGSKISTTAGSEGAGGNGGNTGINTDLLIILEDSAITANAFTGEGGKIKINAQGLLRSLNSEISASSEFGVDGVVEINTPDIEHSRGLAPLPADIVDVSGLIAQGCAAGSNAASGSSEFVITGRGGLPPTPSEALRSDAVQVDLGRATQNQKSNPSAAVSNPLSSKAVPIVEAQGWAIGENGQVMLTAAPTVIPNNSWLNSTTCHGR